MVEDVEARRMGMKKPLCFGSLDDFRQWRELASITNLQGSRGFPAYCVDCTPAYAARMQAEGRCENPDPRFSWQRGDEDGRVIYVLVGSLRGASPKEAITFPAFLYES